MYLNVVAKAQNLFKPYHQAMDNSAKEQAIANPLFSWHVSFFTHQRKKNLVFLNDATTMAVVLYDVNSKNKTNIKERFEKTLAVVWRNLSLAEGDLEKYLEVAGDWQINKSINRSAVGCLTLLCRDVGEMTIDKLDEQEMSIKMTENLRHYKDTYLTLEDTKKIVNQAKPFKWKQPNEKVNVVDKKALRNIIRQLRKNPQTNIDDLTPDQFDNLIRTIQNDNDKLIAMFCEDAKLKYADKTVQQYKDSLDFYLNEWLAYHFQTIMNIESVAIADLLYHGSSENEVKHIRTAMKKLLKYLADNQVVSDEWYQEQKTLLNNEGLSTDMLDFDYEDDNEWSKMDNLMFNDGGDTSLTPIFSKDTDKMIDDYFTAFANLYGVIPSDHAFKIIQAQNPQLNLDEDKCLQYISERVGNTNLRYLIMNFGEVSRKINMETFFNRDFYIVYPTLLTDPRRIITLHSHQLGLQYYVPNKYDLLRFKEDGFFDLGELQSQLEQIFINDYHLADANLYGAIYLSLFGLKLDQYEDLDLAGMTKAIEKVTHMLNDSIHLGIEKAKEHEPLIKTLMVIESHIRRPWNRGYTSTEIISLPTLTDIVDSDGEILTEDVKQRISQGQIDSRELVAAIESSAYLSDSEIERLKAEIKRL